MAPSCPICGDGAMIEYDSAAGNSVCTTCGYVVDENAIVSDVTFGESSTGAAVLQGASLGSHELRTRIVGPRGRPQQSAESRAQTLEKAMSKLLALTSALKLGDSVAESAHRFFTLALSNGFVMGRRSLYVLASCIYVACRMAKLPTMLIDISDLLQVNVFIVGATYLKLVKELCLQNIPLIDPSLYISRFVSLLEFGEETHKVAYDAARLVKRFDTDWMTAGRRPAGVAGASLLIAARMNGFRRSVLEIVQVVKMADVTIKKRLEEFRATASGKMTVEQFRTIWLEETEDPPAFKKHKTKRRKKLSDSEGPEDVGSDPEFSIDQSLGHPSQKSLSPFRSPPSNPPIVNTQSSSLKRKSRDDDDHETQDEDWGGSIVDSDSAIPICEFDEQAAEGGNEEWYDEEVERLIAQEVESHLVGGTASVLQKELNEKENRQKEAAQKLDDARLDDLDDEELDQFILTDQEVEMKTRVWLELNREYLEKLAEKKEREASGELKPTKKYPAKAKMKPRDSENPAGATVEESVLKMITSKKKFSSKINYAIADSLFGKKSSSNTTEAKKNTVRPIKTSLAKPTVNGGHTSLLNTSQNKVQEEDDDDDDDDEEEVEEEIIDNAEFAMMKRDNMVREDDDFEGWGEEA
ncbi:hypothetical protein O181_014550 [Austropuccinia psidii MF-1]|uniref:B-related factor 1 n=1 Tax=Austropuccinia psidii MF-1 TaxID=1389203 RepID=A0A9Q3GQ10_9BASI|nr:hypothetical protein [Austropuccinia psidii MF-1]